MSYVHLTKFNGLPVNPGKFNPIKLITTTLNQHFKGMYPLSHAEVKKIVSELNYSYTDGHLPQKALAPFAYRIIQKRKLTNLDGNGIKLEQLLMNSGVFKIDKPKDILTDHINRIVRQADRQIKGENLVPAYLESLKSYLFYKEIARENMATEYESVSPLQDADETIKDKSGNLTGKIINWLAPRLNPGFAYTFPLFLTFGGGILGLFGCGPQKTEKPKSQNQQKLPEKNGVTPTKPLINEDLNKYDPTLWQEADGWSNSPGKDKGPFNAGWQADNITFKNGKMVLRLDDEGCPEACDRDPYASGEYRSNDLYGYGKYEVSFKAAKNDGIVTSFFTYTGEYGKPNHYEIDIEILGKDTTKMQTNYYTRGEGTQGEHETTIPLGFDASEGFHTYGIEWTKDYIKWYVDGKLVHTEDGSRGDLPDQPQQLMMNLWPGVGVDVWLKPFKYTGPITAEYDWIKYTPYGKQKPGKTRYTNPEAREEAIYQWEQAQKIRNKVASKKEEAHKETDPEKKSKLQEEIRTLQKEALNIELACKDTKSKKIFQKIYRLKKWLSYPTYNVKETDIRTKLGFKLAQIGNLSEALEQFEITLQMPLLIPYFKASALLGKAEVLIQQNNPGDIEKAIALCNQAGKIGGLREFNSLSGILQGQWMPPAYAEAQINNLKAEALARLDLGKKVLLKREPIDKIIANIYGMDEAEAKKLAGEFVTRAETDKLEVVNVLEKMIYEEISQRFAASLDMLEVINKNKSKWSKVVENFNDAKLKGGENLFQNPPDYLKARNKISAASFSLQKIGILSRSEKIMGEDELFRFSQQMINLIDMEIENIGASLKILEKLKERDHYLEAKAAVIKGKLLSAKYGFMHIDLVRLKPGHPEFKKKKAGIDAGLKTIMGQAIVSLNAGIIKLRDIHREEDYFALEAKVEKAHLLIQGKDFTGAKVILDNVLKSFTGEKKDTYLHMRAQLLQATSFIHGENYKDAKDIVVDVKMVLETQKKIADYLYYLALSIQGNANLLLGQQEYDREDIIWARRSFEEVKESNYPDLIEEAAKNVWVISHLGQGSAAPPKKITEKIKEIIKTRGAALDESDIYAILSLITDLNERKQFADSLKFLNELSTNYPTRLQKGTKLYARFHHTWGLTLLMAHQFSKAREYYSMIKKEVTLLKAEEKDRYDRQLQLINGILYLKGAK